MQRRIYYDHSIIHNLKYKDLPDFNILIESDGIQHFNPVTYFGGKSAFKYVVNDDSIKNQYCRDKGIPLLRIPYTYNAVKDKAKIGQFVTDFMQTKTIPEEIKEFDKKIHPATIFYS